MSMHVVTRYASVREYTAVELSDTEQNGVNTPGKKRIMAFKWVADLCEGSPVGVLAHATSYCARKRNNVSSNYFVLPFAVLSFFVRLRRP